MRSLLLGFVSLLVFFNSSWRVSAQQPQMLQYAVVFSDSSGLTHFRDEKLPWQTQQSKDPRYPVMVTPFLDAQKIGFLRLPVGSSSDWHPAPGKRFVMVLTGVAEIEVEGGQRRKFEAGSVAPQKSFLGWPACGSVVDIMTKTGPSMSPPQVLHLVRFSYAFDSIDVLEFLLSGLLPQTGESTSGL
jgi:hypothetical protein